MLLLVFVERCLGTCLVQKTQAAKFNYLQRLKKIYFIFTGSVRFPCPAVYGITARVVKGPVSRQTNNKANYAVSRCSTLFNLYLPLLL